MPERVPQHTLRSFADAKHPRDLAPSSRPRSCVCGRWRCREHQASTRANANGVADQTRRGRDVELPHGGRPLFFYRPHIDVEDFRDLVVRVTLAHQRFTTLVSSSLSGIPFRIGCAM